MLSKPIVHPGEAWKQNSEIEFEGSTRMGIDCGCISASLFSSARGFWLTRQVGGAGDPSLRLKNGCTQDDNAMWKPELYMILRCKRPNCT